MLTPSERPNANKLDNHHMWWRRKDFQNESKSHRQLQSCSSFILNDIQRSWHDRVHHSVQPIRPQPLKVARYILDLGEEHLKQPQTVRMDMILEDMDGFVRNEPSKATADHMLESMVHLSAQMAIVDLMRSYE